MVQFSPGFLLLVCGAGCFVVCWVLLLVCGVCCCSCVFGCCCSSSVGSVLFWVVRCFVVLLVLLLLCFVCGCSSVCVAPPGCFWLVVVVVLLCPLFCSWWCCWCVSPPVRCTVLVLVAPGWFMRLVVLFGGRSSGVALSAVSGSSRSSSFVFLLRV